MAGLGNFAGGFAQGFSQVYAQKQLQQQNEELKKLQVKKYKAELDLLQRQADARNQLFGEIAPPSDGVGPTRGLTDILADPRGQSLMLQSGLLQPGTFLKENRLQQGQDTFNRLISQLQGGQTPESPQGGMLGDIDPLSLLAAQQSQDLSLLERKRRATATIEGPEGPQVIEYEVGNPENFTVVGSSKEEKISPEQAGRIAALKQGSDIASKFRDDFISADGRVKLSPIDLANMSLGTPGTNGRLLRNRFRDAIDSVIRARTGAAAPEGEMASMLSQFMPRLGDDDKIIVDKIDRLESFINGTLDVTTLPKSVQQLFNSPGAAGALSAEEKARKEELRKKSGL